MSAVNDAPNDAIQAAAFRRLLAHLQHRTDVQNIDLMIHGGFCRNCLSDWLAEAATDAGAPLDKEAARSAVYGMTYADYKARHQAPARDEQLAAMAESVARNGREAALDAALDAGFPASDPPSQTQPA